jgi:hypothetical protein
MGIVVTAAAALAAGYLFGCLRPWQRAGDWAADQVRFTGTWLRGGSGRQAIVVLAHVVQEDQKKPFPRQQHGAGCPAHVPWQPGPTV